MQQQFQCKKCGQCCRIDGAVHLQAEEVESIAALLGISVYQFTEKYTKLMPDRKSLTIIDGNGTSCVFLSDSGLCVINDSKPIQCRNFPMGWHYKGAETICRGLQEINNER